MNNRLIDIEKLSRYHDNLKNVLNTKEAAGEAAKAEAAAKKYADEEIAKLSFDEAGAAAQALDAAKEYTDDEIAKLSFDEAGTADAAAAQALQDAKDYADGKFQEKGNYEVAGTAEGFNTAMDERVAKLEAIDHAQLAADASSAAVATILDGAPEKFDTLKEVADWIASNETAADAADLVTRVAALEAIDHDAYVDADATNLQAAKDYADGLAGNYDAAGTAATAEQNAKSYADGLASNYDAAGAAAQALTDAKAYADGLKDAIDEAIEENERVTAESLTDLDDRVKALEDIDHNAYVDADEVVLTSAKAYADGLVMADGVDKFDAAGAASTAEQNAKTYTDQIFNSIQFADNSEIDALFA